MIMIDSENSMRQFAENLALHVGRGDVILLKGNLGTGKTAFTRALIRALTGQDTEVSSPTFSLLHHYDYEFPVYHLDLYRLEQANELNDLGIEDMIDQGLVIVEWPELLQPALHTDYLLLELQYVEKHAEHRIIACSGTSSLVRMCSRYGG